MCVIDSLTTGSSGSSGRRSGRGVNLLRRALRCMGDEQGSNAIEMSAIAIFMFVLIAGIVDIGGAYQHYMVVINSSREGARMYARLPCTPKTAAAVKTAVIDAAVGEAATSRLNILPQNVTITPDPGGACPKAGAIVTVQVRDDYKTLMGGFLGVNTFPIRGQTKMEFYGSDLDKSE